MAARHALLTGSSQPSPLPKCYFHSSSLRFFMVLFTKTYFEFIVALAVALPLIRTHSSESLLPRIERSLMLALPIMAATSSTIMSLLWR